MRLNAWLARAGVASRRGADELIKAGRVTVNGEPGRLNTFVGVARPRRARRGAAREAASRLRPAAQAGRAWSRPRATRRAGRPVVGLVDHPARVVPVGRLDADTTGVLLLTNDGELAHRLAHPRYEIDKVYVADVEGEPTDDALRALEQGVVLEDGPTAPATARRLAPAAGRADDPRGPHAPGQAHARRRRPPGHAGCTARATARSTPAASTRGEWRELEADEVAALRRAAGL